MWRIDHATNYGGESMIPKRFWLTWKRNHKKEIKTMQSITVGAADVLCKLHGRRFLLNDGEVVGVEASVM